MNPHTALESFQRDNDRAIAAMVQERQRATTVCSKCGEPCAVEGGASACCRRPFTTNAEVRR